MHGGGQWAQQLQRVTEASYIEVLVPLTNDPELMVAARRIDEAKQLLRAGEFNACAAQLRQALDPVRRFYDTVKTAKGAPANPMDRTLEQREATMVQSVFGWLSAFIHDDNTTTAGLDMGRAEALQALAMVAGIVVRTAADKKGVIG